MKAAYLAHALVLGSLVACGGGNGGSNAGGGDGAAGGASPYQGAWTSAVNGESYRIDDKSVNVYQHTSRYCLLVDSFNGVGDDDLQAIFALDDEGQALAIRGSDGTPDLHGPIVRYVKSSALPPTCDEPIAMVGDSGYRRDVVRDLRLFGQTFSDYYLSFDLKQVDWEARLQAALASVDAETTDEELFEVLYQLTLPLADAHVQVSSERLGRFSADGKPTLVARLIREYIEGNALEEPLSQGDINGLNGYIDSRLALREDILYSYAEGGAVKTAANGKIVWYHTGDIAYLQIGAMTGFGDDEDAASELQALDAALDRVLRDVQDASGLVIDVRTNNGGRDFLSMAVASRFIATETLAYSKQSRQGNHRTELEDVYIRPRGDRQYLGPIVLLTSNSTVSAAEVFTLMMRSLPNVTLVGERTQGALSDALEKTLPNGFEFSLPNQFYYSAEGDWFEHVGIPVAVQAPFFSVEEREAGRDTGLEAAFTLLAGQ